MLRFSIFVKTKTNPTQILVSLFPLNNVDFVELQVGGPHIPLKTGRRDGRRSRADILEQHLPDHNESMSVVLERFANIGINTPGVVALLGS